MSVVFTTLIPGSVVAVAERVMEAGQAEHGDDWRTRSVAHHVGKAMGHARRALGPWPIDRDSGEHHLALATTRMLLALAVLLEAKGSSS